MASPLVYDAREGISAEALDELRAATRLVLAMKDTRTAVLGYWRQRPGEPGAEDEQMGAIVLRRFGPMPYRDTKDAELIQRFDERQPAVWPLTDDAQHDEVWTRILTMLQPGDVVRLDSTRGGGRMTPGLRTTLRITQGAFIAEVPLHAPEGARQARAARAL